MVLQTTSDVRTLVAERAEFHAGYKSLFVTISPNPNTKTLCIVKGKSKKIPYGCLPQRVQYDACLKIFNNCYLEFLSQDTRYVGVTELNKAGNVHMHILIVDKRLQDDTALAVFQRDIKMCELVICNRKKVHDTDYMNSICWSTDLVSNIDYMEKENKTNIKYFLNIIDENDL